MKNIPKKLDHKDVSIWHDEGRIHERTQRNGRSGVMEGKKRGLEVCTMEAQKRGDVPLLVAIDEPWCDSADVCASANEQEDDEQKRLEIEKGRLCMGVGCVSVRDWPCERGDEETNHGARE